jgi:hypothetical protein
MNSDLVSSIEIVNEDYFSTRALCPYISRLNIADTLHVEALLKSRLTWAILNTLFELVARTRSCGLYQY